MNNRLNLNALYLEVIDAKHAKWPNAKQYISERYQLAFDARLNGYMPAFMALMQGDEFASLCGFRGAEQGTLFLEQYLDDDASTLLSAQFATHVERHQLVEFGQLASFNKGFSLVHFFLIAEALVKRNYQWCIFTATDPLYAMMKRFGLPLQIIADADPNRIPNASEIWGTYYQHQPRIVAGNLIQGLARLSKLMPDNYSQAMGDSL